MKFHCESCGRSYVADDKVRGRAFKMKCKQCGHLIVVKPEAGAPAPALLATPVQAPATEAVQAPAPLQAVAEPAPAPPQPPPAETPAPSLADLLHAAAGAAPGATARPAFDPFGEEPTPPAAARNGPNGVHAATPPNEADAAFAELKQEMAGEAAREEKPAVTAVAAITPVRVAASTAAGTLPAEDEKRLGPIAGAAKVPAPAKKKKGGGFPAVAGVAVLVLVAGGAFAFFGGGAREAPKSPPPVAAKPRAPEPPPKVEPPPAPPIAAAPVEPVAAPAPAPAPEPEQAEPPPAPKPEKQAKAKEPPLPRKPEKKPEPPPKVAKAEPPKPAAAPKPAPEPAAVPGQPPDAKVIAATVAKHERLFQACVAEAKKEEPQLSIAGRAVEILMTVQPSGKGVYPTISDVEIRDTQLGACLKAAATKLAFPPFDGGPARLRVPLVLR